MINPMCAPLRILGTQRRPGLTRPGLTFIECLLAVATLSVAVLGMAYATTAGHQHLDRRQHVLRATHLAEHLIDEIIARPYTGGGPDRATFAIDGYDGFAEDPGDLQRFDATPYAPEDQVFSRSVTVTAATQTVPDLDGAAIPGRDRGRLDRVPRRVRTGVVAFRPSAGGPMMMRRQSTGRSPGVPPRRVTGLAGFTLVETLLALAIASLVAAAALSMLVGVTWASETQHGARRASVKRQVAAARIGAIIRGGVMFLALADDELVIWTGDPNQNAAPDLSELRRVERDPDDQVIRALRTPGRPGPRGGHRVHARRRFSRHHRGVSRVGCLPRADRPPGRHRLGSHPR